MMPSSSGQDAGLSLRQRGFDSRRHRQIGYWCNWQHFCLPNRLCRFESGISVHKQNMVLSSSWSGHQALNLKTWVQIPQASQNYLKQQIIGVYDRKRKYSIAFLYTINYNVFRQQCKYDEYKLIFEIFRREAESISHAGIFQRWARVGIINQKNGSKLQG